MEGTYFGIIPADLVDIILTKLCLTPEVYSYIEALGLNEQKSYRTLCVHMCGYLSDVPLKYKVGLRSFFWNNLYNNLLYVITGNIDTSFFDIANGLVLNSCVYVDSHNVIEREWLYRIAHPVNELFYVLLYEFNNDKDLDMKPYLSMILIECFSESLHRGQRLDDREYVVDISNVINYRKTYADEILSKCQCERDYYVDLDGYIIKRGVDGYLKLICHRKMKSDGRIVDINLSDRQILKKLGYTTHNAQ